MTFSVSDELWFGDASDDDAKRRAAQSLTAALTKASGVRPLPASARRLLELGRDPSCQVPDVTAAIESDGALATSILKTVNSAAFGLSRKCRNISIAVTLLGHKQSIQLATTQAVMGLFRDSSFAPTFFAHSLGSSALARNLALRCGLPTEEMYTCGLLHDIGVLMMLDAGDSAYAAVLAKSFGETDTLHLHERELFGYDHAVLAGHILSSWRIPEPIPQVIAWHHQPARAYQRGGRLAKMICALRFAERLSQEFAKVDSLTPGWIEEMRADASAAYIEVTGDEFPALCRVLHGVYKQSQHQESEAGEEEEPGQAPARATLPGVAPSHSTPGEAARAPPRRTSPTGAPRAPTLGLAARTTLTGAARQVRCGVCHDITRGEACPRCSTPLCPVHAPAEGGLCARCEQLYRESTSTGWSDAALHLLWWTALGVACASVVVAYVSRVQAPLVNRAAALLLSIAALALLGVPIAARIRAWKSRRRFVRDRG